MDEELREFLAERFGGVNQRLEQTDDESTRPTSGSRRRDVRLAPRSRTGIIAEGRGVLLEKIEAPRREMHVEHRETRAVIKLSWAELDRRVTRLEAVTADLEARLRRPE